MLTESGHCLPAKLIAVLLPGYHQVCKCPFPCMQVDLHHQNQIQIPEFR